MKTFIIFLMFCATSLVAQNTTDLLVTASPYNAYCDGTHDDQTAIQNAFNDAHTNGKAVEFPAGTCLFSTVTIKGQSFYGAGKNLTFLKGKPGQDVFAVSDSNVVLDYAPHIHDFTIEVDTSINKAATAAGGDNTFPNRIFGTAGGTTAIPSGYGGAPAPGPLVFDPTQTGNCGGQMSGSSNVLTISCAQFQQQPATYWTGTVTVYGAGSPNLVATITSIRNMTVVWLSSNSAASGNCAMTQCKVTITAPSILTPPWYCGNTAIAIPASSGAAMASNFNGWNFERIQIIPVSGTLVNTANNVCGMFIQAAPNALTFEHVDIQSMYGGIIEAPPASNNSSYFAWTNDTALYQDVNLKFNVIPMTWINGSHRNAESISIYGGNIPFSTGLWQFEVSLGTATPVPSATFERYYYECWTPNSGEQGRFITSNYNADNILGGNATQCGGTGWINWLANYSTIDAQFGDGGVQVVGSGNYFHHQNNTTNWTNTGSNNTISHY